MSARFYLLVFCTFNHSLSNLLDVISNCINPETSKLVDATVHDGKQGIMGHKVVLIIESEDNPRRGSSHSVPVNFLTLSLVSLLFLLVSLLDQLTWDKSSVTMMFSMIFLLLSTLIDSSPITQSHKNVTDGNNGGHHHVIKSRKMSESDYTLLSKTQPQNQLVKFRPQFQIFTSKTRLDQKKNQELFQPKRSCDPGYYECQNANGKNVTCIPIGSLCDGHQDCPLNDDEIVELCSGGGKEVETEKSDSGFVDTTTTNVSTDRIPAYVERIINSPLDLKEKMMKSAIKIKSVLENGKKSENEKSEEKSEIFHPQPITLINFGSMIIGDRNVAGSDNHIGNGNGNGNHNEEPKEKKYNYTKNMKEDL